MKRLIPAPTDEFCDQIKNALKKYDCKVQEWESNNGALQRHAEGPDLYIEQQDIVLSILNMSQACYECYYRAEDCTTRDILSYVAPRPEIRMEIVMAINLHEVVFLHANGKQLHSIPWELIKSVQIQLKPSPLVMFEVLICESSYCVYRFVTIRTKHASYLFSIGNYVLEIYLSMPAKPVSPRIEDQPISKARPKTPRTAKSSLLSSKEKKRVQARLPAVDGKDPFSYTDATSLLVYGIVDTSAPPLHDSSGQLKFNLPLVRNYRYSLTTMHKTQPDATPTSRAATAPASKIHPLLYQPLYN